MDLCYHTEPAGIRDQNSFSKDKRALHCWQAGPKLGNVEFKLYNLFVKQHRYQRSWICLSLASSSAYPPLMCPGELTGFFARIDWIFFTAI